MALFLSPYRLEQITYEEFGIPKEEPKVYKKTFKDCLFQGISLLIKISFLFIIWYILWKFIILLCLFQGVDLR